MSAAGHNQRWSQRHRAAVQASSVYADALYIDVPLFTIIYSCIETSNRCRKAVSTKAFGEINDAELGSRRRSYAATLSPDNKVGFQNKRRWHTNHLRGNFSGL